jgi:hypothetical protein
MTSALLIQRVGSAITVLAGPAPLGDIVQQWKGGVNDDCGRPQVATEGPVPLLEVVELQAVRSHKLRSGLVGTISDTIAVVDESEAQPKGGRRK